MSERSFESQDGKETKSQERPLDSQRRAAVASVAMAGVDAAAVLAHVSRPLDVLTVVAIVS